MRTVQTNFQELTTIITGRVFLPDAYFSMIMEILDKYTGNEIWLHAIGYEADRIRKPLTEAVHSQQSEMVTKWGEALDTLTKYLEKEDITSEEVNEFFTTNDWGFDTAEMAEFTWDNGEIASSTLEETLDGTFGKNKYRLVGKEEVLQGMGSSEINEAATVEADHASTIEGLGNNDYVTPIIPIMMIDVESDEFDESDESEPADTANTDEASIEDTTDFESTDQNE